MQTDGVGVRLLLVPPGRAVEVALEASAEVVHADKGVGDGQDDEDDGEDSKGRQRSLNSLVLLPVARLVDAHELEEEVRQAAEVKDHDAAHADLVLATREECGKEQDRDRHGNRQSGQDSLGARRPAHNDEELNREAEEEEKVEFQQCDVNLWRGPV